MKKKLLKLAFFSAAIAFSKVGYSQDFVLKCSKYYSGSGSSDIFNISISSDKSSGFFVYDEKHAYKLRLTSIGDTFYAFAANPFVSINGNYIQYMSIKIDRQNLQLTTISRNDERRIDCQKDGTDIRKIIEKIERQARQKESDELSRKEKLRKEAQF